MSVWIKAARLGLLVGPLLSAEVGTLWAGNPPPFPASFRE
jgi:hypothetical protein